jgi:hypothetical protein
MFKRYAALFVGLLVLFSVTAAPALAQPIIGPEPAGPCALTRPPLTIDPITGIMYRWYGTEPGICYALYVAPDAIPMWT